MNLSKKYPTNIFFVGIGGSGMSGLAEVLFNLGYTVCGSDIKMTQITERLSSLGIKTFNGHKASNIQEADMIVKSAAIEDNNPELLEAKKLSLPILDRAELL